MEDSDSSVVEGRRPVWAKREYWDDDMPDLSLSKRPKDPYTFDDYDYKPQDKTQEQDKDKDKEEEEEEEVRGGEKRRDGPQRRDSTTQDKIRQKSFLCTGAASLASCCLAGGLALPSIH